MTYAIDPAAVDTIWAATVGLGRAELADTRRDTAGAAGSRLGDLAATAAVAAQRADDLATTALALVDELGANVQTCLATYLACDRNSAGVFHELRR